MGPSPRELHGLRTLPLFRAELWWLLPTALFFGFLTLRGVWALRERRNARALILSWLLVPVILTLYITLRQIKIFNPRYVAVSLPAFYLLWTEAFLSFRSRPRALALGAVLAGIWGVALGNHYFNPTYDKDHVRDAGAYVVRHWERGDFLVTAGASMPIHFYVSRYNPSAHFWLGYAQDTLNLQMHFEEQLPDSSRRVWVVSCRPHWYDPSDRFRSFLEKKYRVIDRQEMLGCSVFLLPNPRYQVTPAGDR